MVLPAPLGPRMHDKLALANGQADILQDGRPTQVNADMIEKNYRFLHILSLTTQRLLERIQLIQHPALVGLSLWHRLGNRHDRECCFSCCILQVGGHGSDRLHVIDQHLDLALVIWLLAVTTVSAGGSFPSAIAFS